MDVPQYQAPPPDPALTILEQQAQQQQTQSLQVQSQQATANLMQQYGARAFAAGMPGFSLASPASPANLGAMSGWSGR